MATHILLDTSPIVAHLRGKFDIHKAAPENCLLFTSLFTVGELEKGIVRANDPQKERARVNSFLQHVAVLMPDAATAMAYGQICTELESKGQRIPENDMWIAAVARECDMTLAASDAHFSRVAGLKVLHWKW